jgi:S1-C subfamily serine protease
MTEHLADPRRPHSTRRVVAAGIAACAIGLTGAGWATHAAATPATTTVRQPATTQQPTYGTFDGPPATTETTESAATDATSAQEVGLVYINTTLDYGTGKAAGTGMVLTADGEILTNHHVVEGATSISVEVVSTGRTYGADVVGYDSTHDVAVLQLEGASGLTPSRPTPPSRSPPGTA